MERLASSHTCERLTDDIAAYICATQHGDGRTPIENLEYQRALILSEFELIIFFQELQKWVHIHF